MYSGTSNTATADSQRAMNTTKINTGIAARLTILRIVAAADRVEAVSASSVTS
jgi:hypothetical protein